MCWPRWGVTSVTYFKLSLRNARRQARDYLVYFITIVLAAALLYAFNGLVFSQEIRTLARGMEFLPLMIVMASMVVVGVFGWLVAYATAFMLTRRSRELGTYLLIGLENRQVARLFFQENLAVGSCALVLGILLGSLLYQAFRAVVLALFGLPYPFALGLSLPALGLTVAYFALIYLCALCKSRGQIRKMEIHELIYFERMNEDAVIKVSKSRRWIFAASILLGILGTLLLLSGYIPLGLIGAGCIILFLFGFFLSFASGVPAFFERRPARKYKGQNLLIFRTLCAKLATIGVLMAVISMVFTATLISEGTGLVFQGLFTGRAAEVACFDLYIGIEDEQQTHEPYLHYIEENIPVKRSLLYPVYLSKNADIQHYLEGSVSYYPYAYDCDPVLRCSDYGALRAIAGYPPVKLQPGQYLFHCMSYLEEPLKNYRQPISLGDIPLTLGGVYTEHLSQSGGITNGRGYILVVPDEAATGLDIHHRAYAAETLYPVSGEQYDALQDINESESRINQRKYDSISTKANEQAQTAAQTVLIVLPLFYLALALTMTAATILSIQQLSESQSYQRQFQLLQKLGMDRREMAGALRTQLAIYYAMPALPPVLIGVPFLLNLCRLPEPGIMIGASSPIAIIAAALGIFFLIYAVYICMAYVSLTRNVLPRA
ncbi:MAG: ABC transporter permease [Provencibacterium sp.]|nr:ABC transporter permease [Provencibacterium sp.]